MLSIRVMFAWHLTPGFYQIIQNFLTSTRVTGDSTYIWFIKGWFEQERTVLLPESDSLTSFRWSRFWSERHNLSFTPRPNWSITVFNLSSLGRDINRNQIKTWQIKENTIKMFGNYFITLAVTRMVVGSSVCTYKRCKTCELIRETSESNEPMFMVTKKAVSQLGNACDMMLRNDFQKNRRL